MAEKREFDAAQRFYHSRQWQKCRTVFIKHRISEDGGFCQICGYNLGYIVHHKIELTPDNIDDPLITMAFENLEYLCLSCHSSLHRAKDNQLNCIFVDGQPQPLPTAPIDKKH